MNSPAALLASLPPTKRAKALRGFDPEHITKLWPVWARADQIAPEGDWRTWLLLGGRGAGKTRAGSEFIRQEVMNGAGRIALVAPTAADARDVMVEGPSGLLSVCWERDADFKGAKTGRPIYEPSKRRLTWDNGAIATLFSADEPDRMRGPQYDAAWSDELAAWNHMREAWDMLQFGLRLETRAGKAPRQCVTTTPRPEPLIRELLKDPATVVSKANTYANAANLSAAFLDTLRKKYEGTRLGRQEIEAEILDDVPGALWSRDMLDKARGDAPDRLDRVVVAVDPSGSDGESGDSQGIVAVGVKGERAYVLEDASTRLSPEGWARVVGDVYDKHAADTVVVEKNYGGDMCRAVLQADRRRLPVKMITATRGKHVRAEPVARLYEQGRVTHCAAMPDLEDQLCGFTGTGWRGEGSPDRADALVWALTELMLGNSGVRVW